MSQQVPLLLRRKEAALLLSCHVNHVKTLVKTGKLKQVKLSPRAARITRESLLALLEQ